MHQLILMRHAEADALATDGGDRDRGLSRHGEDEARAAGRWLAEHAAQPQCLLYSPAARAQRSAELALSELDADTCQTHAVDSIYEATAGELMALLDEYADADSVMLVGHNPGIERLLALLVSGQSGAFRGVPPGAVACIELGGVLEPGVGRLTGFHSPS